MRGQEYVVSLKACGRGMVLETLRYADEVNKASSYFRDIGDAKPDADLLELAETLIEKKAGEFDAKKFQNRYIDALKSNAERSASRATAWTPGRCRCRRSGVGVQVKYSSTKSRLRPMASNTWAPW